MAKCFIKEFGFLPKLAFYQITKWKRRSELGPNQLELLKNNTSRRCGLRTLNWMTKRALPRGLRFSEDLVWECSTYIFSLPSFLNCGIRNVDLGNTLLNHFCTYDLTPLSAPIEEKESNKPKTFQVFHFFCTRKLKVLTKSSVIY